MRKLFVATMVLLVVLTVSPLNALPAKSEERTLPEGTGTIHSSCETVHVKFQESARVRLRDRGLVSLAGDDVRTLLSLLDARPGSRIARIFTRPETQLDAERAEIQRQSHQALPDLNSWHIITLSYPDDQCRIVDQLLALPIVEQAYPCYGVELATVEEHNTWAVGLQSNALVPPDLTPLQGYLTSAPAGIDAHYAWTVPGGKGLGVSLVDVELDWNLEHEDLISMHGREPFFGTRTGVLTDSNHGTAVLGEVVGTENDYGITGIAPQSIVSVAAAQPSSADAINAAASVLPPGDVILVELQTVDENWLCNLLPIEWYGAVYDAISTAVANGIIVVEAAGNGGHNLDSTIIKACFLHGNPSSSGAIIVGAGSNYDRSRLSFSNYGSRVDLQGWGQHVFTAGYGDSGYSGSSENEWYTPNFGGTSSASAIVAGAVLDLQGVAILNGGALSPAKIRNILVSTGSPQTGSEHIGPLPNLRAAIEAIAQPPPPPTTDSATFLSHVTLPDGSAVSPGQALVKTWHVLNSGTSNWNGYKLRFVGGDRLGAPTETSIPTTGSQSTVDISINLTAPTQPGNYSGYFQIINASETEVPGGRLWVKISVQAEESRITFYFDPPSPSAANDVYIKAKAEGISNVRAMRLLIDGQIVSELGATYVDANWDTRPYADGLHSIVAQVAFNGDDGWAYPEQRGVSYELLPGREPANKAPHPPTLTQPGDWHVGWSIPQLCAQHNGDPDGNAVTHYYFEIFESFQNWNSGWTTNNCVTPSGLASTSYQWRVKVRDSHEAESDWSQAWHFSYLDPTPQITQFDFDPPSPSNAEEIWIHTNGTGNVNETIVTVNMATDCSDSGEWHGINHFAGGLDVDSYWDTLSIPAGCHKVRVQLKGVAGVTYQDRNYTLTDPRRPKVPGEIYPVRDQWVNSRTVTFRWEESLRQDSYRLIVSTNSDPGADPSPLVDQTWTTNVTEHTATFSSDYADLYYRIRATNAQGSTGPTARFGIDTTQPSASMTALPATSLDIQIPVSWSASDNLSGVRWYDVQVRQGQRGEWSDWLVHTTRNSEIFPARPGHTYYFRARAMDVAGNLSDYPDGDGHTHTLVDPTAAPPPAWWNSNYGFKRNVFIINQDGHSLPVHFSVHLHFDSSTTPTAQELYNGSLSSTKGDDVRVVYNDTTELDRFVQRFSSTQIDIWFPLQAQISGSGSDNDSYQLYYGNVTATSPPSDVNDVFLPNADANTIGLYHFQDGSGSTVADTSGRGHHGTFQSAAWADGWLGWAGSFNGSSAYVDAGNSSDFNLGSGPMTIEAWIYLTQSTGSYPHVVSKWGPGDGSYYFRINNQRQLHWLLRADGGNQEVVTWGYDPLELNTWYHVAVTYDGSNTMRTFINGDQKQTKDDAGDAFNTTRRLFIGWAEQGADGGHFPGYIQHVRISNVERTSFPYAHVTNAPSVAAGNAILPPGSGSADLVLQSLSTYPVDGETFESGIIVQAIVENQGDAPTTNGFYNDFYADHLPTGGGDLNGSIRFLINDPVAAGATITLTTVIADVTSVGGLFAAALGPLSEASATLYAQADSEGVIAEPDDADNISSGVEVCIASADAYESDDTSAGAQPITLGETQRHNFDSLADEDWVTFTVSGGVMYTIQTSDLDLAADTYLYLYDTDGSTLLAANDDYGGSLASRIDWIAPSDGTYYALVRHWNPNTAGCGTTYILNFTHQCFSLSTSISPSGSGSVSADPPPNCGGGQYTAGTQVQLTANPASGYNFSDWSGDASGSANPITITMDGDKSVTANFTHQCFSLSTSISPSGSVSVDPLPNCGSDQYTAGTQVQLTANPASGYSFSYWSGDASGSANPTTVTMDGDKSVTANLIAGETPEFSIFLPTVARNYPGMTQVRFALRNGGRRFWSMRVSE